MSVSRVTPTVDPQAASSWRTSVRQLGGNQVIVPVLSLCVAGIAWQIFGTRANPVLFVSLTDTLSKLGDLAQSGALATALTESGALFGVGFLLSVVVGIPVGMLLARSNMMRGAIEPYLVALYSTPVIVLIPFILAIWGFGFWPKISVVVFSAIFPMIFSTLEGTRSIDRVHLDVAKSFNSSEWQTWRHVIVPYSLPYVFTGLQQAMTLSLIGTVAAEFFLNASGLGELMLQGTTKFETAQLLGLTLLIAAIAVSFAGLIQVVRKRLIFWESK